MLSRRTTRKNCRTILSLHRSILLAITFSILCACENPFVTRVPEPPEGSGSRWIPPFSAEIVIENLRNTISDRNGENYLRCFSDSSRVSRRFQFIPEITVANNNPGAFVNWSLAQERDYFSQLRAAVPGDSICSLRLDSLQISLFGD